MEKSPIVLVKRLVLAKVVLKMYIQVAKESSHRFVFY